MLILPAIDLIGGRCVRLKQGNYQEETRYALDPLEAAQGFEAAGAEWLHVVDLEGAKNGYPANLEVLERIASNTSLKIEFGGGIRSLDVGAKVLEKGAARFIVGTKIVSDPGLASEFFREFGERVVAGLDAKEGFLAVQGWTEVSRRSVKESAKEVEGHGARRIILTDIARDGMLNGPNLSLLRSILESVEIPVIQSGGISSLADIESLGGMDLPRCEGVIVGKALYEDRLDLGEALRIAASINKP